MPIKDSIDIKRRNFLRLSLAVASGLLLPVNIAAYSRTDKNKATHLLHTFIQPPMLEAKNGVLDITLTASYFDTKLSGSNPKRKHAVSLRAYGFDANGPSYFGPTLLVKGGDQLRIKLVNNLPFNPPLAAFRDATNYMKPNTTNLHVHGLHVSPDINTNKKNIEYGDYVVDPNSGGIRPGGGSRQYVYKIPKNHPAGPFYYHPQYHGSSAIQVASFMSGAIMVRGAIDDIPEMEQAKELIFLFQAPYFASSEIKNNYGVRNGSLEKFAQIANQPTGHGVNNSNRDFIDIQPVLINGVRQPTIVMESGEVQRWRFINTQVFNYLNLSLDEHTLHQYTTDGYESRDYQDYRDEKQNNGKGILLAPGNRSSVIIKAGAAGIYLLRSLPVKISQGKETVIVPGDILATIVVVNAKKIMDLPQPPLPVTNFLKPITDKEFASAGGKKRSIIFNSIGNNILKTSANDTSIIDEAITDASLIANEFKESFKKNIALAKDGLSKVTGKPIDGSKYFPPFVFPTYDYQLQRSNVITQNIILGAIEEWTIFNCNNIRHSFHIHVNPMYIIKVNGAAVDPYWCDTVALPAGGTEEMPTSVTFRMRFKDFTGPYVLHSQMLKDSDLGMIQRVTVLPA